MFIPILRVPPAWPISVLPAKEATEQTRLIGTANCDARCLAFPIDGVHHEAMTQHGAFGLHLVLGVKSYNKSYKIYSSLLLFEYFRLKQSPGSQSIPLCDTTTRSTFGFVQFCWFWDDCFVRSYNTYGEYKIRAADIFQLRQ
jgi:hypothetical protein